MDTIPEETTKAQGVNITDSMPILKPEEKVITPPMISVPTDVLQQILDHQKKTDKELELLRKSANQNKLVQAENASKPAELPRAFLKVYDGKLVTSWKSDKAAYIYNPSNPSAVVGEILTAKYFFPDGTNTGVISQSDFNKEDTRAWFRIVDQNPKDGTVTLQYETLETNSQTLRDEFVVPENIVISTDFLNPQ